MEIEGCSPSLLFLMNAHTHTHAFSLTHAETQTTNNIKNNCNRRRTTDLPVKLTLPLSPHDCRPTTALIMQRMFRWRERAQKENQRFRSDAGQTQSQPDRRSDRRHPSSSSSSLKPTPPNDTRVQGNCKLIRSLSLAPSAHSLSVPRSLALPLP